MYQSEAMWLDFTAYSDYPFVLKVAAGKVNAATGEDWEDGLHRGPQDYLLVPGQPWLDGYAVEKGVIRQFVAMPLGEGYSAEEQVHGTAEFGGVQLLAHETSTKWRRRGLHEARGHGRPGLRPSAEPWPTLLPAARLSRHDRKHDLREIG